MEIFLIKTQIVIHLERFAKILSSITTLHLNQLTNKCRQLLKQLKTTLLHCSRNLQFLLLCTAKNIFLPFQQEFPIR